VKLFLSAALVHLVVLSSHATAGNNARPVHAVRISTPPVIDGFLDEDAWQAARPAVDFMQREPEEGQLGSERTEVRILYDEAALYIGWMLYDSEPDRIVARLTRRDNEIESDRGSIYIDTFHDHQTAYEFTFNAAGVKVDVLQYDDATKEDPSWDVVWDLETRILADGWSAEIRIPFRVLRYKSADSAANPGEWGINFIRYISRKQESAWWAFTPKSESGFISRFGHLEGLQDLPDPRQIDLLPFAVTRQRYDPARPFQNRQQSFIGDAGLDLKYSISNNFTLDATINPDFGQVEADPAVLNLTTFETFYPEKRPFFIEGTQILRFTTFGGVLGPGMFYSRRIGRAISSAEVVVPLGGRIEELSQSTTILGAAKLNGKTKSGLSIGVMQAVTDDERATVVDTNNIRSTQVLEPLAHYSVVRLKQDILTNSNVGAILTSVHKRNKYPTITNGFDWIIRIDNNTYLFEGFFAHTHASSPSNRRIRGSAARVNFERIAARHWLWSLGGRIVSRQYNINDVGFFFRPDGYTGIGTLVYKEDIPAAVVRNYNVGATYTDFSNLDGVNLLREFRIDTRLLFTNYWSVTTSSSADMGLYDDRETRGNGLYRKPRFYSASASLSSDSRTIVTWRIGPRYGWDSKLRRQWGSEVGLGLKPLSWMECEAGFDFQIVRNQEAWVPNPNVQAASGKIFADRNTDQYSLTLRSTITFTRDLTLQFYGQVFLAKGQYERFRVLVGTSGFVPVPGVNSDFNTQSLNTNLVLRWEYLPGSTLFLVWSQARDGGNGNYFSSFSDDLGDTFRIPSANVILLKASYWLSL